MTPDEHARSTIPEGRAEIDALLDGEAVDKEALRTALTEASARDYLVDALILRQWAREMGPTQFVAPARARGRLSSVMRRAAAVLVLTGGVAGGYFYGQRSPVNAVVPDAAVAEGTEALRPAPPPPEPTRVIRFEPGVNWTTSNGGH